MPWDNFSDTHDHKEAIEVLVAMLQFRQNRNLNLWRDLQMTLVPPLPYIGRKQQVGLFRNKSTSIVQYFLKKKCKRIFMKIFSKNMQKSAFCRNHARQIISSNNAPFLEIFILFCEKSDFTNFWHFTSQKLCVFYLPATYNQDVLALTISTG